MRKLMWFPAIALMLLGITCLVFSASSDPGKFLIPIGTFLIRIFLLFGLILLAGGAAYVWNVRKRKR
ncbi:hypothetical protein [Paenibacillus sp. DMB20]|uniref:hypothetical protein n=1 Tax=Paenibacillus sp. DMB20 TaxID=1642570 RepID=UPI0006274D62|nr:hypothetical protein [Paenibacillus sp. DMB20]KKO54772.1 hypothetical protein XI25_04605 [Paenibacillus sp. DMB20]KKO55288.1 hypothetical protein XI25_01865 [Paenibacillus sp. DMB20]